MLKKLMVSCVIAGPLFIFMCASPVRAEVETQQLRTLQLSVAPLDTAVSADGKLIFVLTKKMQVEIYTADGRYKDSLKLTDQADRIAVSPLGDAIFLTDTVSKKVRVIKVSFIQDIDVKGSPFKGPVDAPVVIALFSDYQ